LAEFQATGFLPGDGQDLLRRAIDDVGRMPQHVVAGVAERFAAWDADTTLAAFGATGIPPALHPVGKRPRAGRLDRLAKLVPQLTLGRVVGLGHDQLLATPAQPVAMIERFLAVASVPAAYQAHREDGEERRT
jgi:hypothetical protein